MNHLHRIGKLVESGAKQSLKVFGKTLVVVVSISFVVMLLDSIGVMRFLGRYLDPFFHFLGLQSIAVFAYIVGMVFNIFWAIGVIIALPLSDNEIVILSMMILICHSLPSEISIQKKAGASPVLLFSVRFFSSIIAAMALNTLLHHDAVTMAVHGNAFSGQSFALGTFLSDWMITAFFTMVKLLVVIIGIVMFHILLERSGWILKLSERASPFMKIMGLANPAAFYWLTSNVFGLPYGLGILSAFQARSGLTADEIAALNISLALCHLTIQEAFLFVAIGASIFYSIVPRVIVALVAVWLFRFTLLLKKPRMALY